MVVGITGGTELQEKRRVTEAEQKHRSLQYLRYGYEHGSFINLIKETMHSAEHSMCDWIIHRPSVKLTVDCDNLLSFRSFKMI